VARTTEIVKTNKEGLYIDFTDILDIHGDVKEGIKKDFCTIQLKGSYNKRKEDLKNDLNFILDNTGLKDNRVFWENYFALFIMFNLFEKQKMNDIKTTIKATIELIKPEAVVFIENNINKEHYTAKRVSNLDDPNKKELFFSDEMLKGMFLASILAKFLFIFKANNDNSENAKNIKKFIVSHVWKTASEYAGGNLENKINKVCFSNILNIIYSDKRFWEIAKLHNHSPLSEANKIYVKFISNIIAFMNWDNSPISYTVSIVRNSIGWLKKKNFLFSYDMQSAEKQEYKFSLIQESSGKDFFNTRVSTNIIINETLLRKFYKEVIEQDNEEEIKQLIDTVYKNFKRNSIHLYILLPLLSKHTGVSVEKLLSMNKLVYSIAIIWTVKFLLKNNFFILSDILLSNVITGKNIASKDIANYKTLSYIIHSEEYKKLIDEKYSMIKDIISEENHILKVIALISYNEFESIVSKNKLSYKIDEVSEEVIRFFSLML
jgi:hypothetical protein